MVNRWRFEWIEDQSKSIINIRIVTMNIYLIIFSRELLDFLIDLFPLWNSCRIIFYFNFLIITHLKHRKKRFKISLSFELSIKSSDFLSTRRRIVRWPAYIIWLSNELVPRTRRVLSMRCFAETDDLNSAIERNQIFPLSGYFVIQLFSVSQVNILEVIVYVNRIVASPIENTLCSTLI